MNTLMITQKDILAALALSLAAAQVQLPEEAVVVYDQASNQFQAYRTADTGERVSPGREWTTHHRLWMFHNTVEGTYDAHISYLEDYRPAIRLADPLQTFPNVVTF